MDLENNSVYLHATLKALNLSRNTNLTILHSIQHDQNM